MSAVTREPASFGARLDAIVAARGRLCVGIDPHAELLDRWGLDDSAASAREFGLRVVDAVAGRAGIVKPQVAFFERHGSAGYLALERVLAEARAAGLLVIADAKRGDIGSSIEGYGDAWLTPGSSLEADALTVNPYLGLGALEPVRRTAERAAKGLFVLAATSNPEGIALQRSVLQQSSRAGSSVAQAIVSGVMAWNESASEAADRVSGSMGVVIGATVDLPATGLDIGTQTPSPGLPILAPGFGHQGGEIADMRGVFGAFAGGVIVSESRSILSAGPDALIDAVMRRVDEVGAASV